VGARAFEWALVAVWVVLVALILWLLLGLPSLPVPVEAPLTVFPR